MSKKNKAERYTQDMQANEKTVHISFYKAIAILAGAVISAVVGTAFTLANTGVSDHFILVRAVDDIEAVKAIVVPRGEIEPKLQTIEGDIKEIKADVKEINQDIKDIHRNVVK